MSQFVEYDTPEEQNDHGETPSQTNQPTVFPTVIAIVGQQQEKARMDCELDAEHSKQVN
jgi:hypothetical protein